MKYIILSIIAINFNFSFAQYNGLEMFDESFVHEIRITFEQENYWDSLEYHYEQMFEFGAPKTYMVASIDIDGTVIDSVGVREKGNASCWGSEGLKEPFKIDFNVFAPGTKYDGLKKLNLHNAFEDPSMMRDALAYKWMRDAGIASPRTSFAKVYLNDIYWGLYTVVEQVDDRFLKNNFENNDGDLFKCINNTSLVWQGPDKLNYLDEFELKTNEEEDNWDDFIHLISKINNYEQFEDSISTALQRTKYLRVLAADVLMYNWDSYYDNGRNFYIYYDPTAGAFQWIPWDYNLSFSPSVVDIYLDSDDWIGTSKPLIVNIMESDVYREQYFNQLCYLNEAFFTLEHLETYIDETQALIEDAVDEDPNKFFSTPEFNANINFDLSVLNDWGGVNIYPGLKTFIRERNEEIVSQLEAYAHSCTAVGIEEEEKTGVNHIVYPNPSSTGLFNIVFGEAVQEISVYDIFGKVILTKTVSEQGQLELDLSAYANGLYIIELVGETRELKRIVKQ
jgi:hypothetical protein